MEVISSIIYTANFIMSIGLLVILLVLYARRVSSFYVVTFLCIALCTMGYMQMSSADELQAALYANQVIYMGAILCPVAFLLCIGDLCKVKLHKYLFAVLLGMGAIVFGLISSIGVNDLYYKSIELVTHNGASYLVKEYGSLHIIYPVYICLILGIGIYYTLTAFIKRKEVPYTTSVLLMMSMVIVAAGYFSKSIFDMNQDLTPFAYNLAGIIILILLRRISLLNAAGMMASSMEESDQYGFVVYDHNGNLLGSDDTAKKWFPEISETYVGKPVVFENKEVMHMFLDSMECHTDTHNSTVKVGEAYLEIKHSHVRKGLSKTVHCLYFRDDTTGYRLNSLLKNYNETLEKEVNAKTDMLTSIQNDIIVSMASIVENRDNNTGGHIKRTSDIIRIYVKHLQQKSVIRGLNDQISLKIIKAAPLHDFGKIAIPDSILNKPGKFEPEEYEIMKQHSSKGAVIVEQILQNSNDEEFRRIAVNIAHYHHEKWDGSGYPEKLEGDGIPFEARVMALADVFDALVSKRVYKERMSYDKAFGIIADSEGTHFDPILCKAFLECREELIELYESYND